MAMLSVWAGAAAPAPAIAGSRGAAPEPPALRLASSEGNVAIRWVTSARGPKAARIRIYRRVAGSSWPRAPVASVAAGTRILTQRGLRSGVTYVYRARSVSRRGRYSRLSRAVRITPRRVTRAHPGKPRGAAPAEPQPPGAAPAASAGSGSGGGSVGGTTPAACLLYGPYHSGNQPGACWRPYSASSPFNRPIPESPRLAPNSQAIVSRILSWGAPQSLLAGHSGTRDDYFHPLYYARPGDPEFTVRCAVAARSCAVEGLTVRIPDRAQAAAGGDGHLAVVDQASGWEYDFWQVRSKPAGGGVLTVSHGGRTRIDGDGLGSNATAAWFGLAAGMLRGAEVASGQVEHALFGTVKCTAGFSVYPAHTGTAANACADFGLSNEAAPPLGARLQLAMSDAEIDALAAPPWKRSILRALARYGILIGDTNGGNAAWGLVAESGSSYTSFGVPDPWVAVAEEARLSPFDGGRYAFDVASGVDWSRLRVLDPCVSQGTC